MLVIPVNVYGVVTEITVNNSDLLAWINSRDYDERVYFAAGIDPKPKTEQDRKIQLVEAINDVLEDDLNTVELSIISSVLKKKLNEVEALYKKREMSKEIKKK